MQYEKHARCRATGEFSRAGALYARRGSHRNRHRFYRIIFEDWSREQAKEEMLHGGYGFHSMWDNLPRLTDEADTGHLRQAIFAP